MPGGTRLGVRAPAHSSRAGPRQPATLLAPALDPHWHATTSDRDAAGAASLDAPSTLSTAPLPSRFDVSLALPLGHDPTPQQYSNAYLGGSEMISDAAARGPVARLPIRKSRIRGMVGCPSGTDKNNGKHIGAGDRHGAGESSRDAMWRAVGSAHPCLCHLPRHPYKYLPPQRPPRIHELSPLPPHPDPHQTPMIGDEMLPWSPEAMEEVDLDSAMDFVENFECAWQEAGSWPEVEGGAKEKANSRAKGKRRAGPSPLPRPVAAAPAAAATPATPRHALDTTQRPTLDYPARWSWWRAEISNGDGYGYHTSHLPYRLDSRRPKPDRRRPAPSEYQLPRNLSDILSTIQHPFHPDPAYYMKHSGSFVYWIIPVHGPVVVPGLEDIVVDPTASSWASRGIFTATNMPIDTGTDTRPAPLRWTPALLRAFVHDHFEPTYNDPHHRYGQLSLRTCGPWPSPFLTGLPPPPALRGHQCLPPGTSGSVPAIVECGDHVRIYCEASKALKVRWWLHWWQVRLDGAGEVVAAPRRTGSEDEDAGGNDARPKVEYQPFKRVRLALVSHRSEVLMVA